jgi:hypothetical protein
MREIILGLIWLCVTTPLHAAAIFSIQSVSANAGDTGIALDVLMTNTGPGAITVGAFTFEIASSAEIEFQTATVGTVTQPYIFDGFSLFGPTIGTSVPGQVLDASDVYSTPGGGSTIGSGFTVGIARVFFDVDPVASGTISIEFNTANSSLSDELGGVITIDQFSSGNIDVVAVPEPATLTVVFAGLLMLRYFRSKSTRSVPYLI